TGQVPAGHVGPVLIESVAAPPEHNGDHTLSMPASSSSNGTGNSAAIALVSHANGSVPASMVQPEGVILPPLHPRPNLGTDYVAAVREAQKAIAMIWEELLRMKDLGIHDDFFKLGGDSLLATQIMSRLRAAFQIELPLKYFFEYPTIDAMSRAIETAKKEG